MAITRLLAEFIDLLDFAVPCLKMYLADPTAFIGYSVMDWLNAVANDTAQIIINTIVTM